MKKRFVETHQATVDWLQNETVKYIRKFQLARTVKERKAAEITLLELRSRLFIETRAFGKMLRGE